MKKSIRPLRLHRETIRSITTGAVDQVAGGISTTYLTDEASLKFATHCACQTYYCKI